MSENNNVPVRVTGEERRHPAIRSLARACLALARLRLEQEAAETKTAAEPAVADAGDREEGAANG